MFVDIVSLMVPLAVSGPAFMGAIIGAALLLLAILLRDA